MTSKVFFVCKQRACLRLNRDRRPSACRASSCFSLYHLVLCSRTLCIWLFHSRSLSPSQSYCFFSDLFLSLSLSPFLSLSLCLFIRFIEIIDAGLSPHDFPCALASQISRNTDSLIPDSLIPEMVCFWWLRWNYNFCWHRGIDCGTQAYPACTMALVVDCDRSTSMYDGQGASTNYGHTTCIYHGHRTCIHVVWP